jgi:predicted dehydrogenase
LLEILMLNRRNFLATAASALPALADVAPIGIGFLGASYSHFRGKFDVIRESKDWRLVGICEPDPEIRVSLEKAGVKLLARDALLSHPEITVIAVESSLRDHAADGMAAAQSGKHLHLEKPPAYRMKDFQAIVNAVRAKNRLLQVGYMWRYHPGINKAIEAAQNGWLGSVYLVRASISNQLETERRPQWGEFKGGPMFELGGHVIDPIARLMGRPRAVKAILHKELPLNDKLNDNTLATLEWENAIGTVQSCTLQPGSNRYRAFEVYGTNGCVIANPIEPPVLKIELAKAAGPYQKGQQTVPMPAYRRFVDDFADLAGAVRGEHPLKITADQDLLVEEILLRCCGMESL